MIPSFLFNRVFLSLCLSVLAVFAIQGEETENAFDEIVSPSPKNAKAFEAAVRSFSFQLFDRQMQKSTLSNQLFSPIGISFLLSMIAEGVDEATKEEIEKVAHLVPEQLKESVQSSIEDLKKSQFEIAGLLYLNEKFQLNSDFVATMQSHYASELKSGASHLEVNDWVAVKTAGQIREIVSERELRQAFLLLANVIHFKAAWRFAFRPSATYEDFFSTPSGDVLVPMMHATHRILYAESSYCQAISLPYVGSDAHMLLMLPTEDFDFSWMNETNFQQILDKLSPKKVKITLPKFALKQEIDVKALLHQLGMKELFNSADFSAMVDLNDAPSRAALPLLKLSQMKQHLALDVDEKGTEASAVTSAIIATSCARMKEEEPLQEIVFNRPFIAILMKKDMPIFCGLIRNPASHVR